MPFKIKLFQWSLNMMVIVYFFHLHWIWNYFHCITLECHPVWFRNLECKEFFVYPHGPEKSTLHNYVLLRPLANSSVLNSASCFLFASSFSCEELFFQLSFCVSAHFPASTVCVKGIQRLSKSIYSLQFGTGTNCCYRKVFGFLPHQRQTEYRLGSDTDLIHYTFFQDMKHGSELLLFMFKGKLCVSHARKY